MLRYENGQKYDAHYDSNDTPERAELLRKKGVKGGMRAATILIYLSGEEGGGWVGGWGGGGGVKGGMQAATGSFLVGETGGGVRGERACCAGGQQRGRCPASSHPPPLLTPPTHPPPTHPLPTHTPADVEEGGETEFPLGHWLDPEVQGHDPLSPCGSQGIAVRPRRGDAVLFFDTKPDGVRQDKYSLHAGCPVIRGVKW